MNIDYEIAFKYAEVKMLLLLLFCSFSNTIVKPFCLLKVSIPVQSQIAPTQTNTRHQSDGTK